MTRWRWSAASRAAVASVVVAGTCTGVQTWRLVRPVLLPAVPRMASSIDPPVIVPWSGLGNEQLLAAVAADPFHPDRRRPSVRFRVPGHAEPEIRAPGSVPDEVLRLVGTAVMGDRGFAVVELSGHSPRLVRPGDQLGSYTLESVGQGRAVFLTSAGDQMEVLVPKAGS